jgi:hypothetical protein
MSMEPSAVEGTGLKRPLSSVGRCAPKEPLWGLVRGSSSSKATPRERGGRTKRCRDGRGENSLLPRGEEARLPASELLSELASELVFVGVSDVMLRPGTDRLKVLRRPCLSVESVDDTVGEVAVRGDLPVLRACSA